MNRLVDILRYVKAAHYPQTIKDLNPAPIKISLWDHGNMGFGFGMVEKNRALIVFRGTMLHVGKWYLPWTWDLRDWARDFNFLPNEAGVHRGFVDEYDMYKTEVRQFAADALRLGVKDWITSGHSQGSPTAVIASVDLVDAFQNPHGCITYGCPKFLTKPARNRINLMPLDITNVINGWDLVTEVVPAAYRAGKDISLDQPIWHDTLPFQIADHPVESYENALNKQEKKDQK